MRELNTAVTVALGEKAVVISLRLDRQYIISQHVQPAPVQTALLTDNFPDKVRGHVRKRGGSHCDVSINLRRRDGYIKDLLQCKIVEVFFQCGLA